jgi:hypothetical protein
MNTIAVAAFVDPLEQQSAEDSSHAAADEQHAGRSSCIPETLILNQTPHPAEVVWTCQHAC